MPADSFSLSEKDREQITAKLKELLYRTDRKWVMNPLGRGTNIMAPRFYVYVDGKCIGTIKPSTLDGSGKEICDQLERLALKLEPRPQSK